MEILKKWSSLCIQTPSWISIIVGSALLLWQCMFGSIPLSGQVTVFAVFIFLTGIPHGALDHLVAAESARRAQKPFKMLLFLLQYLGTMLFYGICWYMLPGVSLLFFILISAWHFGETDLEKAPYTVLWSLTRFVFGVLVLQFLLLTHEEATLPILERITQFNTDVLSSWRFLSLYKIPVLMVNVMLFIVLFIMAYKQHSIALHLPRYLRLLILLALTAFLPLLPAFALYFGGWHALSSFDSIQSYLASEKGAASSPKSMGSALSIWSKTLVFTALAFGFFAIGIWYWLHFYQAFDPLPLLFIFLSLITLPHLNVMWQMHKRAVSG